MQSYRKSAPWTGSLLSPKKAHEIEAALEQLDKTVVKEHFQKSNKPYSVCNTTEIE